MVPVTVHNNLFAIVIMVVIVVVVVVMVVASQVEVISVTVHDYLPWTVVVVVSLVLDRKLDNTNKLVCG